MRTSMHPCIHAQVKNCADFLRISAILNGHYQWPRFSLLYVFSLILLIGFSGCSGPIQDSGINDQVEPTPRPSVQSVPLGELFIGTYSGASYELTQLDLAILDSVFSTVFADSLDATASVDSAYIFDSPETDSIPYLILEGVVNDTISTFGVELRREDGYYYCLTTEDDPNQLERVWVCRKESSCSGRCKKVRNGIGVVTGCACKTGSGGCSFDEYGGFWRELGLVGVIIYLTLTQ